MTTLKEFFLSKVIPGLYTVMFVIALLVLSIVSGRRQVYF